MDYFPVQDYREVTIQCVIESAIRKDVPANILLGIVSVEGGREGIVSKNRDGSVDFGRFQINDVHLQELAKHGVDRVVATRYLKYDGCYSAEMAAFLLQRCLRWKANEKSIWERAACYHSKTPSKNAVYREKLEPVARKWGRWIEQNYQVREYK